MCLNRSGKGRDRLDDVIEGEHLTPGPHDQTLLQAMSISSENAGSFELIDLATVKFSAPGQYRLMLPIKLPIEYRVIPGACHC